MKKGAEKPAPKQPTPAKPVAAQPTTQPVRSEESADNKSVQNQPTVQQVSPDVFYTVKSGDSLSKIAQKQYGDASKWKQIFDANRDQIKDANLIQPGQKLKIPKG